MGGDTEWRLGKQSQCLGGDPTAKDEGQEKQREECG